MPGTSIGHSRASHAVGGPAIYQVSSQIVGCRLANDPAAIDWAEGPANHTGQRSRSPRHSRPGLAQTSDDKDHRTAPVVRHKYGSWIGPAKGCRTYSWWSRYAIPTGLADIGADVGEMTIAMPASSQLVNRFERQPAQTRDLTSMFASLGAAARVKAV